MSRESYKILNIDQYVMNAADVKINCYALNYILHQLIVCDKEYITLYDIETKKMINKICYYNKFIEIFESKVSIKHIEPLILCNMWIAILNKRSFLFLNDNLEMSRIYQAEPNPALNILVNQRLEEIMTLRGDRRCIKFWRYEPNEKLDNFDKKLELRKNQAEALDDILKKEKEKNLLTHMELIERAKKKFADETYELEKSKFMIKKYYTFEMIIYSKKQINTSSNKQIMDVKIVQDLNLVILVYDTNEISIYNQINCEIIKNIQNLTNTPLYMDPTLNINIPNLAIDQEFLYIAYDNKLVIYDLMLYEEISSILLPECGKIVHLYAQKSDPNGGIYIITADDMLHVIAYGSKKIIHSEQLTKTDHFSSVMWQVHSSYKIPIQKKPTNTLPNNNNNTISNTTTTSNANANGNITSQATGGSQSNKTDMEKASKAYRYGMQKLRIKISFDISSHGICRILILRARQLTVYIQHTLGQMIFIHDKSIYLAKKFYIKNTNNINNTNGMIMDNSPIPANNNTINTIATNTSNNTGYKEPNAVQIRDINHMYYIFTTPNSKLDIYNIKDIVYNLDNDYHNLGSNTYDFNYNNDTRDILIKAVDENKIEYSWLYHEEKILILFHKGYVHFVNIDLNKKLTKQYNYDIISYLELIPKIVNEPNTLLFYNCSAILATQKGFITTIDCDFNENSIIIGAKNLVLHDGILALRFTKVHEYLITLETSGKIKIFSNKDFELEFELDCIWNQVSTASFINDNELMVGFKSGDVEYIKINFRKQMIMNSMVYRYHNSPVKYISSLEKPEEGLHEFISLEERNYLALWRSDQLKPLKIYTFCEQINGIELIQDTKSNKGILIVNMNDKILKLDDNHGALLIEYDENCKMIWKDGLFNRQKLLNNMPREYKTSIDHEFSAYIAQIRHKKRNLKKNAGVMTPSLIRLLYEGIYDINHRSLEIDFMRYVLNIKNPERNSLWIADKILREFCEKKSTEPFLNATISQIRDQIEKASREQNVSDSKAEFKKTLIKFPNLRDALKKREKDKQDIQYHKYLVECLADYKGPDDINAQKAYLIENYNLKPEDFQEDLFIYAKGSNHRYEKDREKSKTDRPLKAEVNFKLPSLNKDDESNTQVITNSKAFPERRKQFKSLVNRKKGNIKSFDRYAEALEKNFDKGASPTQGLSNWLMGNDSLYLQNLEKSTIYTRLSKFKKNDMIDLSQTYTQRKMISSIDMKTTTNNKSNSASKSTTLAINKALETCSAPFFLTNRSDINKQMNYSACTTSTHKMRKDVDHVDNNLSILFPKRNQRDFVKTHASGMLHPENQDIFKHVFAHLMKNRYFLKKKREDKKYKHHNNNNSVVNKRNAPADEIEYAPLEVKQFILQTNIDSLLQLNEIFRAYETKQNLKLPINNQNNQQDINYRDLDGLALEQELDKENMKIAETIRKIKDSGIHTVSINDMVSFKSIVKKRLEIYDQMQKAVETYRNHDHHIANLSPTTKNQLHEEAEEETVNFWSNQPKTLIQPDQFNNLRRTKSTKHLQQDDASLLYSKASKPNQQQQGEEKSLHTRAKSTKMIQQGEEGNMHLRTKSNQITQYNQPLKDDDPDEILEKNPLVQIALKEFNKNKEIVEQALQSIRETPSTHSNTRKFDEIALTPYQDRTFAMNGKSNTNETTPIIPSNDFVEGYMIKNTIHGNHVGHNNKIDIKKQFSIKNFDKALFETHANNLEEREIKIDTIELTNSNSENSYSKVDDKIHESGIYYSKSPSISNITRTTDQQKDQQQTQQTQQTQNQHQFQQQPHSPTKPLRKKKNPNSGTTSGSLVTTTTIMKGLKKSSSNASIAREVHEEEEVVSPRKYESSALASPNMSQSPISSSIVQSIASISQPLANATAAKLNKNEKIDMLMITKAQIIEYIPTQADDMLMNIQNMMERGYKRDSTLHQPLELQTENHSIEHNQPTKLAKKFIKNFSIPTDSTPKPPKSNDVLQRSSTLDLQISSASMQPNEFNKQLNEEWIRSTTKLLDNICGYYVDTKGNLHYNEFDQHLQANFNDSGDEFRNYVLTLGENQQKKIKFNEIIKHIKGEIEVKSDSMIKRLENTNLLMTYTRELRKRTRSLCKPKQSEEENAKEKELKRGRKKLKRANSMYENKSWMMIRSNEMEKSTMPNVNDKLKEPQKLTQLSSSKSNTQTPNPKSTIDPQPTKKENLEDLMFKEEIQRVIESMKKGALKSLNPQQDVNDNSNGAVAVGGDTELLTITEVNTPHSVVSKEGLLLSNAARANKNQSKTAVYSHHKSSSFKQQQQPNQPNSDYYGFEQRKTKSIFGSLNQDLTKKTRDSELKSITTKQSTNMSNVSKSNSANKGSITRQRNIGTSHQKNNSFVKKTTLTEESYTTSRSSIEQETDSYQNTSKNAMNTSKSDIDIKNQITKKDIEKLSDKTKENTDFKPSILKSKSSIRKNFRNSIKEEKDESSKLDSKNTGNPKDENSTTGTTKIKSPKLKKIPTSTNDVDAAAEQSGSKSQTIIAVKDGVSDMDKDQNKVDELSEDNVQETVQDSEDKMDQELLIYKNRKEMMAEYMKQLESNIQFHVISKADCREELTQFFDARTSPRSLPLEIKFTGPIQVTRVNLDKNDHYFHSSLYNNEDGLSEDELTFDQAEPFRRDQFETMERIHHIYRKKKLNNDDMEKIIFTKPNQENVKVIYNKKIFETDTEDDKNTKDNTTMSMMKLHEDMIQQFKEMVTILKTNNPEEFKKSVEKIEYYRDNVEYEFDKLDFKTKKAYLMRE